MSWDWWISDNGQNMLKGIEGDNDNPPRLEADMIAYLLTTIPAARTSFNFWYPRLLPDEQARLDDITQGLPQHIALDYKAISDNFQKSQNTAGVRTAGPKGGKPSLPSAKGGAPTEREIFR